MPRHVGRYITSTTSGEEVKAFVPDNLPPAAPPLDPARYVDLNRGAELALARLNGVTGLVASVQWLMYGALRREALLTSQIEGTQATLTDLFDVEADIAVSNPGDVEEVANYLRAFRYVRDNLHDPKGLPVSMRLLRDAHRLLLDGTRGAGKQPGEIRRSQNWIGGTRPGNAIFVPPPAERVPDLLSRLERFIHDEGSSLPLLVRIGLVHVQFETIHPFLDGNGRIGRLLIAALIEEWGLLREPLLYLSGYLKRHQQEYYRRLSAVRTSGDWEGWTRFFLEGVAEAALEAEESVIDIATLINRDRTRVLDSGNAAAATYGLFERLPSMPRFTVESACNALGVSFPTANAAIRTLVRLNIVTETTGKKKNRRFGYQAYIDRLSR
jgi:Fic family protein